MSEQSALLLDRRWDESVLRELLVGLLARKLGVPRALVDPQKTFDEYGLDSIDAVVATEEIGQALHLDLPPEFLLINRSIDEVTGALLNRPATKPRLVKATDPIFFVPGAGGRDETGLIRFRKSSSHLLKFDVIRVGDWRDWVENDTDFDGLIELACRHVEASGFKGPLQFAGYSQGGHLVYATALALSGKGYTVKYVGLLDSYFDISPKEPAQKRTLVSFLKSAVRLTRLYVRAALRSGRNIYPSGSVRKRLVVQLLRQCRKPAQRKKLLKFLARHGGPLFRGPGGVRLNVVIQIGLFSELWNAWIAKNPSTMLHSRAVLFRSEEPGSFDHGWRAHCSDLTIVPVKGSHLEIFDTEHVGVLIERFSESVLPVA